MKWYAVAEIDVIDPSWVRDYVSEVTEIVQRRGGRYLARTSRVERVEGDREPPQTFLIIEWPSKEAAESFYESVEYQPYRQRRIGGAKNQFFLVAGEDVTGAAEIGSS
jgi:uncharacterized protein (DUF1330 family)